MKGNEISAQFGIGTEDDLSFTVSACVQAASSSKQSNKQRAKAKSKAAISDVLRIEGASSGKKLSLS